MKKVAISFTYIAFHIEMMVSDCLLYQLLIKSIVEKLGGEEVKNRKFILIFVIIAVVYVFVSLYTITTFPKVHSDELWLKGLAQNMISSKSMWVTEPFYDLYPRVVHPFRWLYQGLVILFMYLVGTGIFSIRLLSLIGAVGCLWLMYKVSERMFEDKYLSLLTALLLGLNVLFVASSHTGRQETWILLPLLLLYYLIISKKGSSFTYSLIIIFSMGIHPNSFLLGVSAFALMALQVAM